MNVIIAGSRVIEEYEHVVSAVRASGFEITTVICGMADGVDMLGHAYAMANNIPVVEMPADWAQYGRRAGYLRNTEMGKKADALIAIYDGNSKGTGHMIDIAHSMGLKVHIHYPYAPAPFVAEECVVDREAMLVANWLAEKKVS